MSPPDAPGLFPVTDWQRLEVLRLGGDAQRRDVLGELYRRYRSPVTAFLRGRGYTAADAEALGQDFFTDSIRDGLFEKADRERGRFRNLVLTALKRYAAKRHRRDQAQVRRPSGGLVSADELAAAGGEALMGADPTTPERDFQRAWAAELVGRVVSALGAEMAAGGKEAHFSIFKRCVVDPALGGDPPASHRDLAAQFGLSEKEVANRLVTAKRAYQRLLRAEIATYARSEAEVDEEIGELFQILGSR